MKQKENLEFHAVRNFIEHFNRTHRHPMAFLRQCAPALCTLNGSPLGVEVVHTYGTRPEAAMRLGNREEADFPEDAHRKRRQVPLNIRALSSLNQTLTDKSTKTYSFSPTWLLVRNAFVLWSLNDYRKVKAGIVVPEAHPFQRIWLLCDQNSVGSPGIMRLT